MVRQFWTSITRRARTAYCISAVFLLASASLQVRSLSHASTEHQYQSEWQGIDSDQWLTYKDQIYGFQIQYPPTHYVVSWPVEGERLFYISFVDQIYVTFDDEGTEIGEVPDIGIVVYANPQRQPLTQWIDNHTGPFSWEGIPDNVLFVDRSSTQSTFFQGHEAMSFNTGGLASLHNFAVAHGSYIIKMYYTKNDMAFSDLNTLYDRMFTTFVLLNQ